MLIINCLIILFILLLLCQVFLTIFKEGFTEKFKEGIDESSPTCCTTNETNITYLKNLTTDYPDLRSRVTALEKKVNDLSTTVSGLEQSNNASYNAQSSSVDSNAIISSANPTE